MADVCTCDYGTGDGEEDAWMAYMPPCPVHDNGRMTNDADLALSILKKIAADVASSFIVERFKDGGHAVIDSSWVDLTEDELSLLERLRDEGD